VATNLREFNSKVAKFTRSLPAFMQRTFQRKIALEALKSLVEMTPVDLGRARGNWQLTIGSPAEGEVYGGSPEGTDRGTAIAEANSVLSSQFANANNVRWNQWIWITNNVPYITKLNNGSSTQAPNGMMEVTLARIASIF